MSAAHTICLGTIGSGIWRSEDGGQSWANIRDGIWNDSNIYSLTADPTDSRVIYAGTQEGIFRSDDRAVSFRKLEGPLDNYQVWAIAVDPSDPTTVMAGCGPSAFFRTRDAGRTWEKMNVPLAESCPNVREPRATALVIDPNDSRIVWAGIEVDGVRRSLDGGDSWTPIGATAMGEADIGEGIWDPDIHDIVVTRGAPSMVITSTPKEIFTSTDLGESWSPLKVKESFPTMYCRPMALKENDSKVLFRGQRRRPLRRHRLHPALQGPRPDVGDLRPASGAQHGHLALRHPRLRPRHGLRLQPLRPSLRQPRRRRLLEQAAPRLRRNLDDDRYAELGGSKNSRSSERAGSGGRAVRRPRPLMYPCVSGLGKNCCRPHEDIFQEHTPRFLVISCGLRVSVTGMVCGGDGRRLAIACSSPRAIPYCQCCR